ncbi:helix-turn-helix transcriptional regulator [Streptomyces sp. NPDC005970]|uniref:helix-turn-helix domain-containing protein n=1 Tax=Streptomyces sp. NPDC005970 TaxID=3156723 RepID=UPI0033EA1DAC
MGLRVDPTYRQRRFGVEVRRLREAAGLTVSEAAQVLGMRQPHVSNVEAGRTSLSAERLQKLAQALSGTYTYPVDALLALGRESGKGWWSDYHATLGANHLDLAELEAGAVALHSYELLLVPGLLQTFEYATAVHSSGFSPAVNDVRETAVEFRMQRQRVLTGDQPPRLHAIIHEAALRVLYGGRAVMRDQLLRLIEASRLPNVTIQVISLEDEGRSAFSHPFMLIEPDVVELGTVLIDQLGKAQYLDDRQSVAEYGQSFARLSELALPPVDADAVPEARTAKDSLGLIQHILYPLL